MNAIIVYCSRSIINIFCTIITVWTISESNQCICNKNILIKTQKWNCFVSVSTTFDYFVSLSTTFDYFVSIRTTFDYFVSVSTIFDYFVSVSTTIDYFVSVSTTFDYFVSVSTTFDYFQGRIQDFKLEGAHFKKLRRAEGGAKIFWVFRVKKHDFTPKNHIFSNFRGGGGGGGGAPGAPPLDPPLTLFQ